MKLFLVLVTIVCAASPVFSSQIGEPCRDDFDCAHDQQECIKRFGECERKGCFCKPDYGGRFAHTCSRMLGASERCYNRASSVGCPPDSDCNSIQDTCVARIKVGSPCSNTFGSIPCTSRASCISSTCTCSTWYKTASDKCVKFGFGDTCTGSNCESNYQCLGTTPTCQCLNSTYTKQTYKEDGSDVSRCVHSAASTDVDLGGACRYGDTENTAKICKSGLTCSMCLVEDAPTCITPGGGADSVKAGFFFLTAAVLLTKLM